MEYCFQGKDLGVDQKEHCHQPRQSILLFPKFVTTLIQVNKDSKTTFGHFYFYKIIHFLFRVSLSLKRNNTEEIQEVNILLFHHSHTYFFSKHTVRGTVSKSYPLLITQGIDGENDILGMKRERLAMDVSLVASASNNEFVGNSCNKSNNQRPQS